MYTKSIEKLPISKDRLEEFRKKQMIEIIAKKAESIEKEFQNLCAEFDERFAAHEWIWLSKKDDKTKDVYYIPEITGLMPNLEKWVCTTYYTAGYYDTEQTLDLDFFNFKGELPTEMEARACFNVKERERYCLNGDGSIKVRGNNLEGLVFKKQNEYGYLVTYKGSYINHAYKIPTQLPLNNYTVCNIPIHRFEGVNSPQVPAAHALIHWLKNDLEPDMADGFKTQESKEAFLKLQEIYAKYPEFLSYTDKITLDKEATFAAALVGNVPKFLNEARELLKSDTVTDEKFAKDFFEELRYSDYNRIMLEPYDPQMLTEQNRGHWDLWDYEPEDAAGEFLFEKPLVARNPEVDVNNAGIVAIDFGTKSTIVAYEDENSKINLLQVGSGDYSKGTRPENFENPTIIEFMHISKFLDAYNARAGRPRTSFNDIAVSHTALNDLNNSHTSELYTSFFDNIKQWCGVTNEGIRITDADGAIVELPPFAEIGDGDLNPLEIYAYYIGSYINHMLQKKHIFLRYILSFPVMYEKNLREKMRVSFENGLKKSLPTALLSNTDKMKNFSVTEGVSEPAAYAITALEHYGFIDLEEPVYYGVFDFGGGTTDFDYGQYRPLEKGRYTSELVHFGAYGDRTLGGENLLDLLAFNVFKANEDRLLNVGGAGEKCKITFTWPLDKVNFPNSEKLISQSQESELNMYNLREKLRPFLEAPDSNAVKEMLDSAKIMVNLFATDGEMFSNYELSLLKTPKKYDADNDSLADIMLEDEDELLDLNGMLRERISLGIDNFFIALKDAFNGNNKSELADISEIAIFLAGNASRASLVKEIFEDYIKPGGKAETLLGFGKEKKTPQFTLYPPLGTKDAWTLQEKMGIKPLKDIDAPTGKTGVAYGLLLSRPGSEIKVTDILPNVDKTSFKFFVGRKKRKIFKVIIDNNEKLNTWHRFIDASEGVFDLFYTDQAIASTNTAPISIAKRLTLEIDDINESESVYIRAVNSNTIEYVVAENEGEIEESKDKNIRRIELT